MHKLHFLSAVAAAALLAGSVQAQSPASNPDSSLSRNPATGPTNPPPEAAPMVETGPVTTEPTVGNPPAKTTRSGPAAKSAPGPARTAAGMPTVVPETAARVVAKGDVVETLKASGQFTTLTQALDAANLTQVLKTNRNLTVFAPTDAAFAALPAGELDRLMASPSDLQKVLTFHVINTTVDSARVKGTKGPVKTVSGAELELDGSGAMMMAGNATVTQADIRVTNGVVHVVDQVLTPQATSAAAIEPPKGTPGSAPMTLAMAPTAPVYEPSPEAERAAVPAEAYDVAVPPPTDVVVVTNGPVKDTAENRAKYPPESRGGTRTAARGN